MKIIYLKGDLLKCAETYILHGCNAQGVMGAGVARLIRAKYPKAYSDYRDFYEKHGLNLGDMVSSLQNNGKIILNAITQNRFGRDGAFYASYEAISKTLSKIKGIVPDGERVAMPKIGAGLGGGDWAIISEIIEKESASFWQPVVYEL